MLVGDICSTLPTIRAQLYAPFYGGNTIPTRVGNERLG